MVLKFSPQPPTPTSPEGMAEGFLSSFAIARSFVDTRCVNLLLCWQLRGDMQQKLSGNHMFGKSAGLL